MDFERFAYSLILHRFSGIYFLAYTFSHIPACIFSLAYSCLRILACIFSCPLKLTVSGFHVTTIRLQCRS